MILPLFHIYMLKTQQLQLVIEYIYYDTTSGDPLKFQLDAGDWGFIPMHGDKTYKAYASNNPTSVEFMVMGQDQ